MWYGDCIDFVERFVCCVSSWSVFKMMLMDILSRL